MNFEKGDLAFYTPDYVFANIKLNAKFTFHALRQAKMNKSMFSHTMFIGNLIDYVIQFMQTVSLRMFPTVFALNVNFVLGFIL